MKLLNAFSFNMIAVFPTAIVAKEISLDEAKAILVAGFESAVGHADTAAVFGTELGVEVLAVRATVSLQKGEQALVGQYKGPRLPEGCKTLPEGATIQWLLISVE